MKRIILLLTILATSLFAQVTIDTATVTYNDNVTRIYGRATFVETPNADEYTIGFLFGESYNDLSYVPMGSYTWDNAIKQLTFWTDLTNLDIGSKDYYTPYIQPKHQVRKFLVGGDGEDIVCEPIISSASGTLRGEIDEQLTFSVTMEDREESCSYNYQWSYKLATEVETYDTVETVIYTTISYTYPEEWTNVGTNSTEWTTPKLKSIHDRAMVRIRAYNSYGEDFRQGTIRVTE